MKDFIKSLSSRNYRLILGWATLVFILVLWEMLSRFRLYNPHLFPPPTQIAQAYFDMINSGEWIRDLSSSLYRFGMGFLLGNALGVLFGVITGRSQMARATMGSVLNYLRSTPSVALIPLAIVWVGIGEVEKIFIVTWGVTFPVWLNTSSGIAEVEQEYIRAAQSLGVKGWRMYREVYLPRALPFIIAGARMGIATAFFALAAAEMSGAYSGIAYRIFYSHQIFRTDKMMVAILSIGLLGIIIDRLFVFIIQKILPWWREEAHVKA